MAGPTRRGMRTPVTAAALALGLTALVWLSSAPAGAVPPPAGATVVGTASPTCPSPSFATVQPAITAAAPGDTIYICAGTYAGPISVNKDLTLLGSQWGVDARTGRTDTAAETALTGPGNIITITLPAASVTVDGFTLTGGATGIFAVAGSSDFTFTNNVVTGNHVGFNFNATGPAPTEVTQNRFVENNLAGPNSGTSVFVTNGTVSNLLVADNHFEGNVGDGTSNPADINTPGGASASSGITISGNTSVDDTTFLVINNTTGTQVTGNTITQTDPATVTGGAIVLFGTNTGMVVDANTIDGGAANGIRAGSFTTGGDVAITGNTIANRSSAIRLGAAGTLAATVTGNTIANSTTAGIWLEATIAGATVDANTITSTVGTDCQDDSTGGATAGTANTWTTNIGTTSNPAGLCLPPPPATTTTTEAPMVETTTTISGATTVADGAVAGEATGQPIPRTGTGTGPMAAVGLGLVAAGILALAARRAGAPPEPRHGRS